MTSTPESRVVLDDTALEAACFAMGLHCDADLSLDDMKAEAKENPEGFEETKRLTAAGIRAYLAAAPAAPAPEPETIIVRVIDTCDGLLINAEDFKRFGLTPDHQYEGKFLPDGRYRIVRTLPPATAAASEITMGRGLVDVVDIQHEGRKGILFRPRNSPIPVGEPGELQEEGYWPVAGDVVIWIESSDGAQVIHKYLADFLPPAASAVKVLEWRPWGQWGAGTEIAQTPAGDFFMSYANGRLRWYAPDRKPVDCRTEAEAKAAAQADYERRVRACLELGQGSTVLYRNWRGEIADRTIIPLRIWHGATDWHPEPQLLLTAWDVDKQAERDFALADFLPPPPAAGEG